MSAVGPGRASSSRRSARGSHRRVAGSGRRPLAVGAGGGAPPRLRSPTRMRGASPVLALCAYERVTTAADGADGGPNPTLFFAMTVQVYVLAALRFFTSIGDALASFERVTPPSDDTHAAR